MQHLRPSSTLQGGKYKIDAIIGEGGFGNTYVATNTGFDETVAIKEFFMKGVSERDETTQSVSVSNGSNYESFRQQKEKFKKEARRLRQFDNPHIVRVHDMFEENGTAYYVMDFIDGENMSERMKRTGKPLAEPEVRRLLPQILDALKSVHEAGLWHLDLKPGNIMVDKQGNVKLIDFGASKQLDTQTGGASALTRQTYTTGYAPREQMEENFSKYGPWTDLYALGATLYALLTKKHPPKPSDIDDDMSSDKHDALPMSSSISADMRRLVLWMMNTNRAKRPQSVDEVRNSALLNGGTTSRSNIHVSDETVLDEGDEATMFVNTGHTTTSNVNEQPSAHQYRPANQYKQTTAPSYQQKSKESSYSNSGILGFALLAVVIIVLKFLLAAINNLL